MKKIFALGILLLAGLFLAVSAEAKVYTVKKGDTLSKIAQDQMGSWRKFRQIQRLKNGEKVSVPGPKYMIYLGEKLWIPEPKQVEQKNKEKIKKPDQPESTPETINPEVKAIAKGLKKEEAQPQPVKNMTELTEKAQEIQTKNSVMVADATPQSLPKKVMTTEDLAEQERFRKEQARKKREEERKIKFKLRDPFESVDVLNLDYTVYGAYPGEDNELKGHHFGANFIYRPFEIRNIGDYGDRGTGAFRFGLGAKYGTGNVEITNRNNGRYSEYDYHTYGLSFSSQYIRRWDQFDFDIGVLWHETNGNTPATGFQSTQNDKLWDLGFRYKNELRRFKNKTWIPEWTLGAYYRRPFDTEYSNSNGLVGEEFAYDEHYFQIGGSLWIRDFYLAKDRSWYLTPGWNTYLGYHWGKDSGFIKFGPMVRLTAYEQDIVELSVLNPMKYFKNNGSRIYWFALSWRVDDTIRAIRVSQVRDYEPDDMGRTKALQEISLKSQESKRWLEDNPGEAVFYGPGYEEGEYLE